VHGAGAGIERHVLAEDHRHFAVVERVLEAQSLERLPARLGDDAVCRRADPLGEGLDERLRDDEPVGTRRAVELGEHVVVERMQADRLARRKRPGRRGPDRNCGILERVARQVEAPRRVQRIDDGIAHVHRRRVPVLVLDLRLRKRGATVEAPVHRLEAAHKVAAADDRRERRATAPPRSAMPW
jgi:hypothetical protein